MADKNAELWNKVEKALREYEELYQDEPKVYTDVKGNVIIYSGSKYVITGERTFTRWQKIKLRLMSWKYKKNFKVKGLKNGK